MAGLACLFISSASAQWSTSGNNTIHTNSGNVGIGINNPYSALYIARSGINPTTDYPCITVMTNSPGNIYGPIMYLNASSGNGGKNWGLVSSGAFPAAATGAAGNFAIYDATPGSGSRLVITPQGNVGIGSLQPKYKFHVADDIQMDQDIVNGQFCISGKTDPSKRMVIGYDVNGAGFGFIKAGWYQNQWTNLVLQPGGGNVSIGTTESLSKSHVNTNSDMYGITTGEINASNLRISGTAGGASGYSVLQALTNGSLPGGLVALQRDGGSVSIGTADPKGYKLAIAGSAIAESVTVKIKEQWPDFVFKPGYKLPSLSVVRSYVNDNGHLPEMPSAVSVEKNGVDLGAIVRLQMKKIEEMTLYLIDQRSDIDRRIKSNRLLQRKYSGLKNHLAKGTKKEKLK